MSLIGRRVEANYGALHPIAEGVIYGINETEVLIKWEDGRREWRPRFILMGNEVPFAGDRIGIYLIREER